MQATRISKHHDPLPASLPASLPLGRAAQNLPRRWAGRAWCGLLLITLLGGCRFFPTLDRVLPDRREEYKKHRELEALEIPPDLTQELPTEPPLVVDTPDEGATPQEEASQETATDTPNPGSATSPSDAILSGVEGPDITGPGLTGGVILQVTSGLEETWPRLRKYWINAGHDLSLDDMELGVMETSWSPPYQEDNLQLRDKVTLITEEIDHAGNKLVIHLHYTREMLQEDPDGNSSWLPTASPPEREQQLAAKLSQHLGGVTSG